MPSSIEFNGKRYDAVTGKEISRSVTHTNHTPKVIKPSTTNSIDGILNSIKQKEVPKTSKHIEIKSDAAAAPLKPKAKPARAHQPVQHHRHTERSHTLMRPAVKKPDHIVTKKLTEKPKVKLYDAVTKERARRAQNIPKSQHISKFHYGQHLKDNLVKPVNLPVVEAPPVIKEIVQDVKEDVSLITERFDEAIDTAEAHLEEFAEEKLHRKNSRKFAYATVSTLAVALIAFGVFQSLPLLRVKMASNTAGFSATLPKYSPSGYSLNDNYEAKSGEVALTYDSRTNNQNYRITQEPSQWNSQSLLNNYLLSSNKTYERLEDNGKTIYLYNDSRSATWLDSGVWYRLEGNANLSNEQMLKIINSL